MTKGIFISAFLTLLSFHVCGQVPTVNFNVPIEVCLEEQFQLDNTSTDATNYEWDFCTGDFDIQPTAEIFTSNTNYKTNNNISIYFESKFETSRYVFLPSGGSKKVFRFKTDDKLNEFFLVEELDLSKVTLGRPIDISILKLGANYLGYLVDFNTNSLYEINFGSSIENQPISITDLGNFSSLNQPIAVKAIKEGDNIKIAVTNYNSTNLTIINKDVNGVFSHGNFNTGNTRGSDIDFLRVNGNTYGIMAFPTFGSIRIYNFGSEINTSPTLTQDYSNANMPSPNNSKWLIEGGKIKALVQSNNGSIGLMKIADDFSTVSEFINYGNFGLLDNTTRGLSVVQNSQSEWHALVANINTNIYKVNFDNPCEVIPGLSISENPTTSYSSSGIHPITLTACNEAGNSNSITKELTVSTNTAPTGELVLEPAYCIADNITFTFNTTDDITSYNWDFGDGNASNAISPTHQYASDGEFYISLEVESAAGCPNIFYDTLTILPDPQPEFSTIDPEYCTFEPIGFSNTTPFDYGENASWSWGFNGEGSSTQENPDFTFESAGTKTITLEVNVLGCVQTYQSTLEIIEGPEVDFSYNGNCLGEAIQFTNLSTGANITGYEWDFGNTESSTAENPQITYNEPGTYEVTFTVSNSSGCENTTTQNIRVFEQVVDSIYSTAAIENLPFYLGIDWVNDFDSTQNLNYQWEIDGEIQTSDTVNYTLDQGTYTVNLEITTSNNCLFAAQKLIEVTASENPSPAFILTEEVCQGEQFQIENTSVNTDSVLWDFCTGNFDEIPVGSDFLDDSPFTSTNNVKIFRDGSELFAFVPSRGTSNVYRASISENLEIIDGFAPLINESSNISGPIDIDIIQVDENYIGYVIDFDNRRIYKLDFGSSLANQPTFEDLGQFAFMNGAYGIAAIQENGFIKLVVSNFSNNNLGIVSIDNANNLAIETINLGNRSRGVDLLKRNDNYYGAVAIENAGIVRILDFGSSVNTTITNTYDISIADLPNPNHVKLFEEGGNLQALVYANNSNLANLNFEDSFDANPTISNYGNMGVLNTNIRGFDVFQNEESNWKALFIETSGVLKQISFDKDCGVNPTLSITNQPTTSFSQPGTYPITLTAYHPNGNSASITKEITVNNNQAPEISFTTGENLCISNPIDFSSASDGIIATYDWDFGDGTQSTLENPSHTYASAGTYAVKLNVTDTAGCNNLFVDSITVFEEPVPDFQATAQGSLCSQKPLIFENLTVLPTEASFFWDFGDGNTSTDENPEHVYAAAGDYIVSQSINMAGCAIEKIDTITINPGPSVAFQVANTCLGEILQFENTSQGDFLAGYEWDFGDGTQSTQTNPNHRYDTAGVYNVLLTAFTTNGCDFTISQSVEIQPLAEVAFESDVACVGQPTQFTELVNIAQSNITDYFWEFGVSGTQTDISTAANPEFTFPASGTYNVSLQVTTSDGCTTAGSQTITVNAAPQAEFEFEQSCINQTRLFSPLNTSNSIAHFWELENSQGELVQSSQSENFSFLFSEAGTYQLTYRQQNESLCSSSSSQSFTINEQPLADFSWGTACANEAVVFENLSELNGNTLANYNWSIDGEFFSNNTHPQFTFEDSGEYLLRLEIETEEGCIQSIEKTITVAPSPIAFFELVQNIGAYPFTLNLVSPLGIEGLWTLNGDTISTTSELNHTIEQPGTYLLGLILTNEAGCIDEHYEQIRVREPNLDVSLSNLRINQDDEFTSFVLNIANRGSLVPQRIDLDINVGSYSVSESIESPIYPESNRNFSLSLKLTEDQIKGLSKICIEATPRVGEHTDSNIQNNRICTNLESGFKVLDMYPNPAVSQFTIPLIVPESDVLNISMEDSNGRNVKVYNYNLEAGYNEIQIQRESFSPGIYFLRFRFQGQEKVKKIIFQ